MKRTYTFHFWNFEISEYIVTFCTEKQNLTLFVMKNDCKLFKNCRKTLNSQITKPLRNEKDIWENHRLCPLCVISFDFYNILAIITNYYVFSLLFRYYLAISVYDFIILLSLYIQNLAYHDKIMNNRKGAKTILIIAEITT